jgi:HK97 family phage prohead protease
MSRPLEADTGPRRETRAFALEVRAVDDYGNIEGYGSVFDVLDSYGDRIAAGAFKASLAEHKAAGTMPAMLWQHDATLPIGVWTEMSEDDRGLKVRGRIVMETERGRETHWLLKAGAVTGLSIGFMSKEWEYDAKTDVRTLTEVDLWEVSLVTFPANGKARVTSVKSADIDAIEKPRDAERLLREAGLSKGAATEFVSVVMRMGAKRREADEATKRFADAAERLLSTLTAKE